MKVMVDLANLIHPNIVMTGDCPSAHDNKKVPMLDLAIYVEEKIHNVDLAGSVEQVKLRIWSLPRATG